MKDHSNFRNTVIFRQILKLSQMADILDTIIPIIYRAQCMTAMLVGVWGEDQKWYFSKIRFSHVEKRLCEKPLRMWKFCKIEGKYNSWNRMCCWECLCVIVGNRDCLVLAIDIVQIAWICRLGRLLISVLELWLKLSTICS